MDALSSKVTTIETMVTKIEGEFPKDTPSKEKLELKCVQTMLTPHGEGSSKLCLHVPSTCPMCWTRPFLMINSHA